MGINSRARSFILILLVTFSLIGCGGGGATMEAQTTTTTTGQQLIDLDKAYKAGIITEKEYEKKKKEILKN